MSSDAGIWVLVLDPAGSPHCLLLHFKLSMSCVCLCVFVCVRVCERECVWLRAYMCVCVQVCLLVAREKRKKEGRQE